MPFPFRKLTSDDASKSFDRLRTFDSRKLWKKSDLFLKYPSSYPLTEFYLDIHDAGQDASDYFHQSNRFRCSSVHSPSPLKIWTTEKLRRNFLGVLWSMKYTEVNSMILRQALSLRGYVASAFRSSSAKAVYEMLASREVLDLACGFGNRLAGFASANDTRKYVGCDPNHRLFNGYQKQVELYGSGKEFELVCSPAEDLDFGKNKFDTVFSSLPFYRSERYANDPDQSWVRYRTLDSWLQGFLFRSLASAWQALKPKGFLAINLADVYSERKVNKIVDPMINFLASECGGKFVCGVGYRIRSRPQKSIKKRVGVEGIWIFQKGM